MNRMFERIFLFFMIFMYSQAKGKFFCKVDLIRSIRMHGLIKPNRVNPLCPKIILNCCTNHDIMFLHKMWNNKIKRRIILQHKHSLLQFGRMKTFYSQKNRLELGELALKFEKNSVPPLSGSMVYHLSQLTQEFDAKNSKFYMLKIREAERGMDKLYSDVMRLREGGVCSICNFSNHKYFKDGQKTMVYSSNFCNKFILRNLQGIINKYAIIFNNVMLLDEFAYITTNEHIVSKSGDRNILKRYILLAKKCKKRPVFEECQDLCKEFNLNRFTYLMDGEGALIGSINSKMNTFMDNMLGSPEK